MSERKAAMEVMERKRIFKIEKSRVLALGKLKIHMEGIIFFKLLSPIIK